ncbi:hypothetical protein BC628DRAFT_333221 [Trametes gibbosa]|nr:hypothetical protein BC628DRAFT_333221 [Trametes gibbosa]
MFLFGPARVLQPGPSWRRGARAIATSVRNTRRRRGCRLRPLPFALACTAARTRGLTCPSCPPPQRRHRGNPPSMSSTSGANSTTAGLLDDDRPDRYAAGPILVQTFLQYLCQGVIISQSAKFYHRWQNDPVALRVYKTWVETIDGKHWWTSPLHSTEFILNAFICSLCEAFLIRRCYRITQQNIYVFVYLCTLLLTSLTASIYLTVRIAKVIGPSSQHGYADPLHASMFAYPLWVYVTLVMALSLTIILSVSLWRTRTGLRHLDHTLNHIIFITFESAALPTACMLASAVVYSVRDAEAAASPASPVPSSPTSSPARTVAPRHGPAAAMSHLDLFFVILTGKVYTLGLLRTLNSRTQFRAGMHTDDLGRRSLSAWDRATNAEGGGAGLGRPSWAEDALRMGEGQGGGGGGGGEGGDGSGGEDRGAGRKQEFRESEETMRDSIGDPGRLSVQSNSSVHFTMPKMRKNCSRDSYGASRDHEDI